MRKPKSYIKGILKIEPLNRLVIVKDVVSWINPTNTTFYGRVIEIKSEDEVWFKNNYPTEHTQYCHTFTSLNKLIPLRLFLTNDKNDFIGTVSKNIVEGFLKNEIQIGEEVWYELKNNLPRIHKGNLICI